MKKSQLARIVQFDKEVRFKEYPNRFSFSVEYGVSDRTVARDIEYLRDRLEAPLEYDPQRKGYFYKNEWTPPTVFSLSVMKEMDWVPFLIEQIKMLSDSKRDLVIRSVSHQIPC